MRNEAARRTHEDASTEPRPASGRRMKAAAPKAPEAKAELGLAMSDALQHILEYEHRTA